MNKGEFIKAIDALAEVVKETLLGGDKIQLAGFGTFELKEKPERDGINPLTGEKVTIKASKAPSLRFGKAYKDMFN